MYYSLRSLSTICNCSFQQASFHICQRKTQLCFSLCVQAPGHAVVCGGVLQITFNGLQKTVGNLTLGCLGASEVIVEVADVCQLEPRVRQQGYGRENIEALDKATGSVAGHRTRVRRGNGI